jgi:starch-binding outer membrane protein, SusD/RagB family
MKRINKNIYILSVGLVALSSISISCKKEYINPSSATTASVTQNADALMNLAAGLQRRFTLGRQSPCYNLPVAGGFGILALKTTNPGNVAEAELESVTGSISPGNSMVTSFWTQCLLGKNEAEIILNNISIASDPTDRVGLKAYASIFYALNVGSLTQYFEKVPLVVQTDATFSDRGTALSKIIQVLESADADLSTNNPSAKFLGRVPAGIDIKNTVKALLARYYNMLSMVTGTYDAVSGNKAISFAQAVNLGVKSEFRYSAASLNAFGDFAAGANVFASIDSTLGLKAGLAPNPAATDPRIGFYIRRAGTNLLINFHGLSNVASMPVYLPGEMSLIVAENFARQSSFGPCQTALNIVRQKTTDIYGINANQPAYSGAVNQISLLQDIYKQRRIELFLSGMELEDSRRFARVGPAVPPAAPNPNSERRRNFYPYPLTERTNNTNTPADPVI